MGTCRAFVSLGMHYATPDPRTMSSPRPKLPPPWNPTDLRHAPAGHTISAFKHRDLGATAGPQRAQPTYVLGQAAHCSSRLRRQGGSAQNQPLLILFSNAAAPQKPLQYGHFLVSSSSPRPRCSIECSSSTNPTALPIHFWQ